MMLSPLRLGSRRKLSSTTTSATHLVKILTRSLCVVAEPITQILPTLYSSTIQTVGLVRAELINSQDHDAG
jgi:hypothetical protein